MQGSAINRPSFSLLFQRGPETLNASLGVGQWDIPALRRVLGELLPAGGKIEDFEVDHDFPGIGRKIMLLDARQIQQHGDRASLILLWLEDMAARG